MAFGTASEIFTNTMIDIFQNTLAMDWGTDEFRVALFSDTGTPSQSAATGSLAYNTGAWLTTSEKYDGTEWPSGGQALASTTVSVVNTVDLKFDANDEVSDGTSVTLTGVMGCFIYDNSTTPKQGFSYHYFGSPTGQAVTDGTFTVVFNTSGIASITL